jgi:glutamyl-tRNA reductase
MDTHLFMVGIDHNTTPIASRERLAVNTAQLRDVLPSLSSYLYPSVILSTCNRTEVYTVGSDSHFAQQASIHFLKDHANINDSELLPYVYVYQDRQAIEHLFRVASGLDSMIIGEFEILGQVGQALEVAEQAQTVDLPLRNLFQSAIRTGRRVREETLIGRNALSVSSVAVDLATEVVGDLSSRNILVIGAGEAGRLVAKAAKERGGRQIAVISRSWHSASALAAALGGRPAVFRDLNEELDNSDIVICCTAAPHTVLGINRIEETMQARPERPLVIIDIAVPRDVEPGVERIKNVYLHNIDDLVQISYSNHKLREEEIRQAEAIVKAEVDRFTSWWQTLEVRPTVSALVKKAESIRRAQLNLTLRRLPGLSDEEQHRLEAMTKAIVRKILHDPIQSLKGNVDRNVHTRESYIQLVRELFRLDEEKQK